MAKGTILKEFMQYLWQNKLWWMIPIALLIALLTAFFVTGSALGPALPFLYPFL